MSQLFVVTREGIYRHEILGVFHSLEEAKACALATAEAEDGYHDIAVGRIEVGKPVEDDTPVGRYTRTTKDKPYGDRYKMADNPVRWVDSDTEGK